MATYIIKAHYAYTVTLLEAMRAEAADELSNKRLSLSRGEATFGIAAVDVQL
jgi:hypothetical protein